MQASTVLVLTMVTLSLLSTVVKPSPILPMSDDESSVADHTAVEQDKEFKRICGLSFYCQRFKNKKRSWTPSRNKRVNGAYRPYRPVNDQAY